MLLRVADLARDWIVYSQGVQSLATSATENLLRLPLPAFISSRCCGEGGSLHLVERLASHVRRKIS